MDSHFVRGTVREHLGKFLKNDENKIQVSAMMLKSWTNNEITSALNGRFVILVHEGQAFDITKPEKCIPDLTSNLEETN